MKGGLCARAWWLAPLCVCSGLGVSGQCFYNTTRCFCTLKVITCVGLTSPPELLDEVNDGNWTKIEFLGGDLKVLPALPPGIKSVVFRNVPLLQLSDLDPSSIFFNSLTIDKASFKKLPEVFHKLQNLTQLFITETPLEDWDNKTLASLGTNLKTLYLMNTTMKQWPPGLSQLQNLKELYLFNLPITAIPEDAFSNMSESLASLQLWDLRITSMPSTFFDLKNLTSLILGGNYFTNVTLLFDLMSSSPVASTLNSIDVASMGLTILPNLTNYTFLRNLTFRNNPISEIDKDSLPSTLTSFDCSYCSISSIPPQMERIIHLTRLVLTSNKIQLVDLDSIPATVTNLFLDDNKITEITCLDTNTSSSIKTLYLQNNMLSAIPVCIQTLSRLSKLYIRDNQIEEINFDSFPPNLTVLDLQRNKISYISPANSTTPSLLSSIILNNNSLNNIDPLAFVNLINLKTLSISFGNFTRLPTALSSLTALTSLSISFNKIESCQCPPDADLVHWFQSRNGRVSISGYCPTYVDIQNYLSGYCDHVTSTVTVAMVTSTTHHNSGVVLVRTLFSPWSLFITLVVYQCTVFEW